jgi:hypothetical protein
MDLSLGTTHTRASSVPKPRAYTLLSKGEYHAAGQLLTARPPSPCLLFSPQRCPVSLSTPQYFDSDNSRASGKIRLTNIIPHCFAFHASCSISKETSVRACTRVTKIHTHSPVCKLDANFPLESIYRRSACGTGSLRYVTRFFGINPFQRASS